jgi:hypothetical protein
LTECSLSKIEVEGLKGLGAAPQGKDKVRQTTSMPKSEMHPQKSVNHFFGAYVLAPEVSRTLS